MKNIFLIPTVIVFLSCHSSAGNKLVSPASDSANGEFAKKVIDSTARPGDSLSIVPEVGDTLYYAREDFAALKKSILGPNGFALSPDKLEEVFKYTDNTGQQKELSFSCEACLDNLYETYAYVLRPNNGITKYKEKRKKLVELFRIIDEMYNELTGGGTYFGHLYQRIPGYAEYDIFKYKEDSSYYNRSYSIEPQKKLYLQSLRQMISDEIKNNHELLEKEKPAKQRELFTKVNKLNDLVTDYFYLISLQRFQYSHF